MSDPRRMPRSGFDQDLRTGLQPTRAGAARRAGARRQRRLVPWSRGQPRSRDGTRTRRTVESCVGGTARAGPSTRRRTRLRPHPRPPSRKLARAGRHHTPPSRGTPPQLGRRTSRVISPPQVISRPPVSTEGTPAKVVGQVPPALGSARLLALRARAPQVRPVPPGLPVPLE